MRINSILRDGLCIGLVAAALAGEARTAAAQNRQALEDRGPSPWAGEIGEGFEKGSNELEVLAGLGTGMPILGSRDQHDWGIGAIQYGYFLSGVKGVDHWYRGNWEVIAQLFGMGQFHPVSEYVIGGGPLLRYNFATGTRWVPFADLGAGVTQTSIRGEDLSTPFEFNLQIGLGVHYFVRKNLAVTLQYRYIHLSNAGMDTPNLGINSSNGLLGVTVVF